MISINERTKPLKQSGIRSASIRCAEVKGINLGQGVCALPVPDPIKVAARKAIDVDKNLYSACEGVRGLRDLLVEKIRGYNQIPLKDESQVMVSHGSTGAFVCAVQTVFNAGDEVILFEPFYGYHKSILALHGVTTRSVQLSMTDLTFDTNDLMKAVTPKTRGIVICTPGNPSGKVFSRDELLAIGEVATSHDLTVITDEVYEYITYPGHEHRSFASLGEEQFNRTITISGFSKTYNMTGWRLGYASGPSHVMEKMSLVQDLLYVCPSTPLQYAVKAAFDLGQDYYDKLAKSYLEKRDFTVGALEELGFKVTVPQGAYYLMTNVSHLGCADDQAAVDKILDVAKVATVAGRSFYENPEDGKDLIRICYALEHDTIAKAMESMKGL